MLLHPSLYVTSFEGGYSTTDTERRGHVVNTPVPYSGGRGFKTRPRDRLS
jgi:hypothetical protein